ncbi:EscU/YscU/HrcU family type III secretion system export apparatus switch protein [Sulfurimonas sp. SAG-AH-194-C21]|nr:EscU/YscU/HrcU family type III secretion system export apparatus switch protein [Sulfurimonas sp. SAG-AH-194-C21]MDF1883928.1 EscU/YscU/HrcU family type III secretion system export apparatus switch protein [Sulfurimonas sp. SAG-AH-194-C21]
MSKEKAVALKYDSESGQAPKVTAKGEGFTAQNIIKIAKLHDIPIKKDEDLVELLSKLEIDREVPAEMYKAIAEVFSYVYKLTT